jgi:hypothetical protein
MSSAWPSWPLLAFYYFPIGLVLFVLAALPTYLIYQLRAEEAMQAADSSLIEEDEDVDHGPGGEGETATGQAKERFGDV